MPRFVDVNLRPPWTPLERALELAHGAAWLKVNHHELARLLEREHDPDAKSLAGEAMELRHRLEVDRLVVTWGDRGAWIYSADGESARARPGDGPDVRVVDTVGAGDALAAALIAGVLAGWSDQRALTHGVELADAVCGLRGATPRDLSFYERYRAAWEEVPT